MCFCTDIVISKKIFIKLLQWLATLNKVWCEFYEGWTWLDLQGYIILNTFKSVPTDMVNYY